MKQELARLAAWHEADALSASQHSWARLIKLMDTPESPASRGFFVPDREGY